MPRTLLRAVVVGLLACGGSGSVTEPVATPTSSETPGAASIAACAEGVDGDHLLALAARLRGETLVSVGPNGKVAVPTGDLDDAVATVLAATERRQIREADATFVVAEGVTVDAADAAPIGPEGPVVELLLTRVPVAELVGLLGQLAAAPVEVETEARVTIVTTRSSVARVLGLVRAATGLTVTHDEVLQVTGEGRSAMARELEPQLHVAALARLADVTWILLSDGRVLRDGAELAFHPITRRPIALGVSGPEAVTISGLGVEAEVSLCEPIVIAPPGDWATVETADEEAAVRPWPAFRGPLGPAGVTLTTVALEVTGFEGRTQVSLAIGEGSAATRHQAALPHPVRGLEGVYLLDADDDGSLEVLLVGKFTVGDAIARQAVLVDHQPMADPAVAVSVEPRFAEVRSAWDVSAILAAEGSSGVVPLVFRAPR